MIRFLTSSALLCLLFVVLTGSAFAQTGNGQVGGIVQDISKALVPGVSVTLTNADTGIMTTQITNESGAYTFPSVPPGTYTVSGSLPGFKTSVTSNVQVGVSAQVRVNITLEVGAIDAKVEVSVTTDQLLRESAASVVDVLPAARALDLPLVGNDVLDLVKILPGYRISQFSAPGFAVYDTFAGQTLDTVNVTRDGLSVNNGRYSAEQYGLSTTTNINPELVGEIRLILAPVDAELGRGNSQVQILTRSGTNRYTGSAVWHVQNTALNANTWDNNNDVVNGVWTPTQPNWRNAHNITLTYGGPIIRNKTFFFVAWDQQISNTRSLQTTNVWTDTARQGIFRYWEKWNPLNANPSNEPTSYPVIATTAARPAVDFSGNPLQPDRNPDGTSYVGGLRCFSVFGNMKVVDGAMVNVNPAADCPGGTFVSNATPWDPYRLTFDTTGYINKVLTAMPRANYFQSGDGLNTAGFRWVRPAKGEGGGNAAVGVADFVNRKQINIKIDQNFNNHRISGSWSYQKDNSGDFLPNWPDGLYGETRRTPQVVTITGTSTLSAAMLNEARFGMRRDETGEFIARESSSSSIRDGALDWYLQGGTNPENGQTYPVAFNPSPAMNFPGNGAINIGSQSLGNTSPLYNFADTLSWTKSRHSFKFGGEVRLTRSNGFNSVGGSVLPTVSTGAGGLTSALNQAGTSGIFTQLVNFQAQAAGGQTSARAAAANLLYFMYGSVNSATMLRWINDSSDVTNGHWEDLTTVEKKYRDQIANEWSGFVKDDWKVTKNLTLNLGLRYDYYGSPYIGSGFTTAALGLGSGLFGISGAGAAPFDRWLTPGNTYLTGYGGSTAGITASNALQCLSGVQQSPLLPVSNCDPNQLTQIEFVGPNTPNPDKVVIPVDRNNWGPAIGFAWQLPWFGEGKTTVRGGYQITYAGAGRNGISTDALLGSAPGAINSSSTNTGDTNIQAILASRALNLTDLPILVPVTNAVQPGQTLPLYGRYSSDFEAYDPNFSTPYTQNLTLQVTRSVARNMTLDVRYVSTLGRKMEGTVNLNLPTVFDNPELMQALDITRAGGNAALFDQMFAGLNISGTTTGYGAIGTCVTQPAGSTAPGLGQEGCGPTQVMQHGSAHLRRAYATLPAVFGVPQPGMANGNYVGVINALGNLNTVQSNGPLQALPTNLTGVSARVLRNGCDRIANGLYNPANPASATNIPTRCFPEDYFYTNPQFNNGSGLNGSPNFHGNFGHNNYHSMQVQYTLRPTQGSSLQTTYTWQKLLTDDYNTYVDPRHRQSDYSLSYSSIPHEIRMNGTFELPFGPNRLLFGNSSGWVARLLERWQTSVIYNWGAGAPRDAFTSQFLYAGGGGNQPQARPNIVGPWVAPKTDFQWNGPNNNSGTIYGSPSPYVTFDDPQCLNNVGATDTMGFNLQGSCTLNGLALVVPAGTPGAQLMSDGITYGLPVLENPLPGQQGNLPARVLRLPGRWSLDANLSKSFRIGESRSVQIRFDSNNILNHPNPGEPTYNIQSSNFGAVTADKSNNARTFQGQVRLSF